MSSVQLMVIGTNLKQANKLVQAYVYNSRFSVTQAFDHHTKEQIIDDVSYDLNISVSKNTSTASGVVMVVIDLSRESALPDCEQNILPRVKGALALLVGVKSHKSVQCAQKNRIVPQETQLQDLH